MIITPIRTKKVVLGDNLEEILQASLPKLEEQSIVVITSKIVSITQGNIAPLTADKDHLVIKESCLYFVNPSLPQEEQAILTIRDHMVTPWAGIDASNSNNSFVLLPKNPMQAAEKIWQFLCKTYQVQQVGVIIADSTFIPLRTGSVSVGLAWCGFEPIKSYIGMPDIFGRKMQYTTKSFVDTLAIAAESVMGEGNEQQPVAVITGIPGITFVDRIPNKEEIASMHFPKEKDLFGPLIQAVTWKKGEKSE